MSIPVRAFLRGFCHFEALICHRDHTASEDLPLISYRYNMVRPGQYPKTSNMNTRILKSTPVFTLCFIFPNP